MNGLKIREGAYLLSPRSLYDQAIIATTKENNAIYSIERLIEILMESDQISHEDAVDHLDYNILGASLALPDSKRPFFCDLYDGEVF